MDLLMGTRGYRRFEWLPGLAPSRPNRYLAMRAGSGTAAVPPAEPTRPRKVPVAKKPADDIDALADNAADEKKPEKKQDARPAKDLMAVAERAPRDEEPPAAEKKAKKEPAAPMAGPAPRPAMVAAAPMTPPMAAPPPPPARAPEAAADKAMPRERAARKPEADDATAPDTGAAQAKVAMRPPANAGAGALDRRMDGGDALELAPLGRPVETPEPVMIARRPPPRPPKPPEAWAPIRVFPAPTYQPGFAGTRNDFRETIAWQPSVQTDKDGKATVSFYLSDAVTSFRVVTEGVGAGAAGRDETILKSSLPFSLAVKMPLEVSEGDKLKLPLVLANEQSLPLQVKLEAQFGNLVALDRPVNRTSGELAARARDTLYYPLTITGKKGQTEVHFIAEAGGLRDEVTRQLRISPRGFPQHIGKSGRLRDSAHLDLELAAALPDTADGELRVYPSLLSNMVASLEGMLQHPSGCFEQASSSNYPNIMILRALREDGVRDPRLIGRASRLLDEGYKRLVGYETPLKGYEWFGAAPGHEALTAYGLLQFSDMRVVYHDVDRQMITRTADWLMGRRDGKGGFQRDGKSLDSFGAASKAVTDAYITYSLTEAKQAGLEAEVEAAAYLSQNTGDAYLLALSTSSLWNAGRRGPGQAAAQRLAAMQDGDGSWKKADHSITRSGGENLLMETTALAIMALLKSKSHEAAVDKGVEWVMGHRRGSGAFGSTQATVLGLRALVAYMATQGKNHAGGSVTLTVNGQPVATRPYDLSSREPVVIRGLSQYLKAGPNRLELRHTGSLALPYSLGVDYRSLQPATSSRAAIDLSTTLERTQMKMGESVRLLVTLTNKQDRGQPMTLARVELPGGLTFQNWQLKELREKGLIGFYETQPREVNLYLRDMKPRQKLEIPLDLVAIAAGDYTAQASSAYLYYTDEHKTWVAGTQVSIEP
jgi:hypothetical protein